MRLTYHGIREIRGRLAENLKEFMGSTAIADSAKIPSWLGNILADKQRAGCRADRLPEAEKENLRKNGLFFLTLSQLREPGRCNPLAPCIDSSD